MSSADNVPESLNDSPAKVTDDDVFGQFGKYIAAELRGLPLRESTLLQQEIQSSITKVKLSCIQPLLYSPSSNSSKSSYEDCIVLSIPNYIASPSHDNSSSNDNSWSAQEKLANEV